MLDRDVLKSDSSSDEKTYYAEERVRRRFKRHSGQDSDIPELQKIVNRVARARPVAPVTTHKTPLFRTQSDLIFDAISRENFELRRQNEDLRLEVERLKDQLRKDRKHEKERRLEHSSAEMNVSLQPSATQSSGSQPPATYHEVQPEWVPSFFEALTLFMKENLRGKGPEQEEEEADDPAKEIIGAIKQLQTTLKELSAAAQEHKETNSKPNLSNEAPQPNTVPTASFPAHMPVPQTQTSVPAPVQTQVPIFTPSSGESQRAATPRADPVNTIAPEIISALKDLKVAVSRPVSVTLEPSKALAEMFAHEMAHEAQEAPALSTSSSTIENEEFASDEARRFLQRLRETDPKQYQQVLENIRRKVNDGDSTQFQEFVNDRLGNLA